MGGGNTIHMLVSLDGHKITVGHGFLNLEINDITPLTGRNYMLVKPIICIMYMLSVTRYPAECNKSSDFPLLQEIHCFRRLILTLNNMGSQSNTQPWGGGVTT